jgi:hypothetical protein
VDIAKVRRSLVKLRARKANVRFRELKTLLKAAGWVERTGGRHQSVFVKPGRRPIPIPDHPKGPKVFFVEAVLEQIELDMAMEEERSADNNR